MKVLLIKSGEIGQGPCRPHRQRHSLLGTLRWGHQQEQKAAPEPRGRALEAWGGACGPGSLWRPGRALPLWAPRSSQLVSKSVGLGGFPRHLAWLCTPGPQSFLPSSGKTPPARWTSRQDRKSELGGCCVGNRGRGSLVTGCTQPPAPGPCIVIAFWGAVLHL